MKTHQQLLGLAALTVSLLTSQAQTISLWNFNGASATTVPGGELAPTPATGLGTASLVGGVTAAASFGSGTANGGSSDPATTTPANYGWQTTTFPTATANNLSAGVQFLVSTVGYQDISLKYDVRHSNTSSRYEGVLYTLDGGSSWTPFAFFSGNAGDTWFKERTVDFSSITGADNNVNFGVRIVAAFESSAVPGGADSYLPSNATGSYAASGTWRFDMVTVSGVVVPEPTALSLAGIGLVVLAFRQRVVVRR